MTNPTAQDPARWTIEALLITRPEAARILLRNGMACVGCVMAPFETVAEAAREYRLDLRSLLNELREKDSGRSRHRSARVVLRPQFGNTHGSDGAEP
jgi:hybrid cluster-associated redox disulfide protein